MNPYQAQLYRSFSNVGIAASPVNVSFDYHRILGAQEMGVPVALHLHWLNVVLANAESTPDAIQRVDFFLENLKLFKSRGGQVVWTVHNRLPHDAVFANAELALRRGVAEVSDVIHVMSPSTAEVLLPDLDLPEERTVCVPHPNYLGCYPDYIARAGARHALGIEPDEFVFVLFGAIKPYKGLTELLEAFETLRTSSSRRLRLIVAGKPDASSEATEFVQRCRVNPDVLINPQSVGADHVQIYLRAADLGVAPYRRTLNSGAVALYQTFGLPALVPDDPGLVAGLSPGSYVAFGKESSLLETLLAAAEGGVRAYRVASEIASVRNQNVSEELASILLNRLVVR
jgi:glycosyltransferase involved in cell wall biosynthesis